MAIRALYLFCVLYIGAASAQAEEEVFTEEKPATATAFAPLEQVNADLEPGQNPQPVADAAPVDLIKEEEVIAPAVIAQEEVADEVDMRKVKKVEVEGNIEKLTMKNGDVVINVRGKADLEKTLTKILGSEN